MKITKKQYNDRKAMLNARLAEIDEKLAAAEATNANSLWEPEMETEDQLFAAWDKLHDDRDDAEEAITELESEWTTRNWTANDWNSWNLIADNVD